MEISTYIRNAAGLTGLAVFACNLLSAPGATVPQIYASSAIPGDLARGNQLVIFDGFTSSRDSMGRLHFAIPPEVPHPTTEYSSGFITLTLPNGNRQIAADTSWISYRSAVAPTGPGPCLIGTAGWYAGKDGLYMCIVNDGEIPFVWGWNSPNGWRYSSLGDDGVWVWK